MSLESRNRALISRSVTGRRSFITLKCPRGYVFSNVKFTLKGRHSECLRRSHRAQRQCSVECLRSYRAQQQCRWRRHCRIDTKVKSQDCSVSAIQMSNLKCVPKGENEVDVNREIFETFDLTEFILLKIIFSQILTSNKNPELEPQYLL